MDDIKYHQDILKNNSKHIFSLCILGHYYEQEDASMSLQYYNRILQLDPNNIHILCRTMLTSMSMNTGNITKRIKNIFTKLQMIHTKTAEILITLGIYCVNSIHYTIKQARSYFLQAYKLDPCNLDLLMGLIMCCDNTDKYFLEYIYLDNETGNYSLSMYHILHEYYKSKNMEYKMIKVYENSLKIFPYNADLSINLSSLMSGPNEGLKILEHAYEQEFNKKDTPLIVNLFTYYLINNNIERSIKIFNEIVDYKNFSNCISNALQVVLKVVDIDLIHNFFTQILENHNKDEEFKELILITVKQYNIDLYNDLRYIGTINKIVENESKRDICPICIEKFEDTNKPIITLSCSHCIHYHCIKTLKTCPTCRKLI